MGSKSFLSKFRERVANTLFGDIITARESRRVKEVTELLDNDGEWRSLQQTPLDLSPVTQTKMLNMAHFLAESNPTAKRILHLYRDFIVGDGVSFDCEDEEVKSWLDKFWNDPVNNLELHWDNWAWEIWRDGELIIPVAENEHTGRLQIGYIDPRNVREVRIDKNNSLITTDVVLSSTGRDLVYKVVQVNEKTGLMEIPEGGEGGTFFFAVNRPTNATRGKSDLFPLADWLDVLDRTLFSEVERNELMKAFIWDVEIKGDGERVRERTSQIQKDQPDPGSMIVHNNEEIWKALTPDFKQTGAVEFVKYLKNYTVTSAGLPPHYMGEAEDVNRSTGDNMRDPVVKMLKQKGKVVGNAIKQMLTFAVHRGVARGMLQKTALDAEITVNLFDPSEKDTAQAMDSQLKLTDSLMVAEVQGWISKEDASRTYCTVINGIGGINITPLAEKEPAEKAQIEDKAGDEDEEEKKESRKGNGKSKAINYNDVKKYAESGRTCGN